MSFAAAEETTEGEHDKEPFNLVAEVFFKKERSGYNDQRIFYGEKRVLAQFQSKIKKATCISLLNFTSKRLGWIQPH